MLFPNGQRIFCYPGRHVSGALAASGAMAYGGLRGARLNRFVSETYSPILGAVPSGYSGKSYLLAVKAGGMSGFSRLTIAPIGAGVLGLPGEGSASIDFTVADATGALIASGAGTASLAFTVANALLTASIGGIGSASFTFTATGNAGALASGAGSASMAITFANAQPYPLNDASPLRTGAANFAINGTLVPYAIGVMGGSTVTDTVLTTSAIANEVWSTLAASFTVAGTMGNKLNSAASGGVDYGALADAVLAAALTTPIAANVKQINDTAVAGTGVEGDTWGPA